MRILVIHQDLFFQGGQYVAAKIISGLAARGHEVHVALSRVQIEIAARNPDEKPFPIPEAVEVHILPSRRALGNIVALARLFRRIKPDVVMPHVGHYMQASVLARLLSGRSTPIVYVEHNAILKKSPQRIKTLFSRHCYCRCNSVITVTNGVRQRLLDAYGLCPGRVETIYNPVIDDVLTHKCALGPTHPWLLEKGRHVVFVAAGALCRRKGFDLLLLAFAKVLQKVPQARLIIFGRGEEREALLEQSRHLKITGDQFDMPGFTSQLPGEFSAADCFVLSSRKETFGIVLVEGLAVGTKVVSFDCPVGPREVLQEGRFGRLVPVGDVKALSEAMVEAVTGGRTYAPFDGTVYEPAYVLDRYEEVLAKVVGEGSRAKAANLA